ncbi:hypothetical protein ACFQ3P_11385 [Paraburkholderia sabiae]|uniref:Uncharacterized protein n=1 Tax=Paraburkholderia sabiae TaxID=273251 RepID=A0ABU9Q5W4_9BURK|nr:hypothetical protein [Paraburkholderia sabiae]WJZ78207.1 hypothetical protein QEN71_29890 [Paraburkholderia sabiae]CAD6528527.1 hypothetical protein LMG24235_02171 [Paraburkholderia sabiae]
MFFGKENQEQKQRKRAEKETITSLENTFGRTFEQLRALFEGGPSQLESESFGDYPGASYQGGLGINVWSLVFDIESHQFPRFLNLVREGSEQTDWLCFRRIENRNVSTLLATESRFRGVAVRMLSNDAQLIRRIETSDFNPAPPWIAMYEHGPFMHLTQGAEEYWDIYIWRRFWRGRTLEQQRAFLSKAREETIGYIADEQWADWMLEIRMSDPRTRTLD